MGWTTFRFSGLDDALAAELQTRWGSHLEPPLSPMADVVRIVRGDASPWLPPASPGDVYRFEGHADADGVVVRSHNFALARPAHGVWTLALNDDPGEPTARMMDNAARYLVARSAIGDGGLAFHGAGVERGGRAWIFVGPSRAGKSTAVSLSAPARSLGDDFAVVLPEESGFGAHAVPFDNAEVAPRGAPVDPVPLEGILKLHQAATPRLTCPSRLAAQASLVACAAFPWAYPDLIDRLQANAEAILEAGLFAHLEFAKDPSFWALLDPSV